MHVFTEDIQTGVAHLIVWYCNLHPAGHLTLKGPVQDGK